MAALVPRRVAIHLLVALAALLGRVWADCVSYGIDYANGGSYQIDGSSNADFVFNSMFQGCSDESITPVLMDPSGNQYPCSAVETTPDGVQATSTCGIPYSQMRSGQWKIILRGQQLAVQRVVYLTVGSPETVVVTATPTVIVGVTSTPAAITVITTRTVTQTRVLPPATVTTACSGNTRTQTVTVTPTPPTVVRTSTLVRSTTDAVVTRINYTTLTRTAYCHFPTKRPNAAAATAAAEATVAATTVTYTQTTYTVTETSTTVVPPSTTTETQIRTAITTITPAPSTTCTGASPPKTITITRPYSTVTVTTVVTSTVHLTGTVTIGSTAISTSTDKAVASACWRAGGWMGWP